MLEDNHSRVVASEVMAFFTVVAAAGLGLIALWSHAFWMDEGDTRIQSQGTNREGVLAGISSLVLLLAAPLVVPIFPFGRSVLGKIWTCIGATTSTLVVACALIRAPIVANAGMYCASGLDQAKWGQCPGSGYSVAMVAGLVIVCAVGYFVVALPSYVGAASYPLLALCAAGVSLTWVVVRSQIADFRLHERKQLVR